MEIKDFTQLEEFLFKKKQRFVDMFLWQLHLDGTVDKLTSVGLHDDIRNCIQSLKRKYSYSSDPDNTKGIIEYYINKCNRSLIPDEHLNWLDKKNLRQCNFVWLLLKKEGVLNPSHLDSLRGNSDKHYVIIRALDLFPEKMPFKIKEINETREAWQNTKNYAGWRYDWLDMHDESQCKKTVDFLTKKVSEKSNGYSKPLLAHDDNELNDYYKFLASVDIWTTLNIQKQDFYKKITDASRKWKTPEQKKVQVKLKSKAKENNHVLLKDKKSLALLQSIKEQMKHESLSDTLMYILNEKHDEIFKLSNIQKAEPKVAEVNKPPCNLKSFEILKERASSQLRTLCDYSIKLQRADIFDHKLSKSSKQKAKELFKSKEIKLFDGLG